MRSRELLRFGSGRTCAHGLVAAEAAVSEFSFVYGGEKCSRPPPGPATSVAATGSGGRGGDLRGGNQVEATTGKKGSGGV